MIDWFAHADPDTSAHVERVSFRSGRLAMLAGLGRQHAELIARASRLHDVGKVAIPDRILLKPAPLTVIERLEMERHTILGYQLLRGTGDELLELAATIAWTHHERYDGRGYPRALGGEEIPIEGRITAIADVFDALTSHRVYRDAIDPGPALLELLNGSGTQFDPELLNLFVADLEVSYHLSLQQPV